MKPCFRKDFTASPAPPLPSAPAQKSTVILDRGKLFHLALGPERLQNLFAKVLDVRVLQLLSISSKFRPYHAKRRGANLTRFVPGLRLAKQ